MTDPTNSSPQLGASLLAPGYVLDRYELLCPIAEGGMASVWVARQRGKHGFEKLVAIKTILPKFASDPRFQEMFLDEARIASRIEHVNVAQIFDLGEEHDVLYLAMEYVDGEALSKLNRACQRKNVKIPTGVVLRILADTCAGLHEAHELHDGGRALEIVHRDVSPHNILVSARGIAKLIDFGIAKARSRVGNDTNSGVLKGKIQYMAPEQALGRPVDRRADIWAIGAILYHLIAGKPAYEGDNQLATLHLLGSGQPPAPLPDAIHPAIVAIVSKALAYDVKDRFATAAIMRDAIERAMAEAKVTTTVSEVAAFANEHLAERTERRRQAIELALGAAAERRRIHELLRPTADGVTGVSGTGIKPSALSGAVSPSTDSLVAESLAANETAGKSFLGDGVAKLTPRVSEPPAPGSLSYATLGSASLDAPSGNPPRSRKGMAWVALATAIAAGATVVSFAMFRPKLEPSPAAVAAGAGAGAGVDESSAAVRPSAPPTPPPPLASAAPSARPAPGAPLQSSTSSRQIPVISATSLPPAPAPVIPAAPPFRPSPRGSPVISNSPAPASPPPAPSPAPATKTKNGAIDDGF